MHSQKLVLIALCIAGMVASFLPWVTTPGLADVPGTDGGGWITFSVFALIIIVILTGRPARTVSMFSLTCISILAILNAIYGCIIINYIDADTLGLKLPNYASAGVGLYLLIVTGFIIPVSGFI